MYADFFGSRWRERVLAVVLLAGVIVGIYSVALRGPFVFDDAYAIVESDQHHRLPQSWRAMLYSRSVPFTTLAATYVLAGLDIAWFRAGNIAIHAGVTAVVFWLLYQLARVSLPRSLRMGRYRLDAAFVVAFAGAAFFAVHPIQTQGVTYIVQRLASLAALFYLLTVAAYVAMRRAASRRGRMAWLIASLAAALLAVHSKEIAVTLPAALLLIEGIFFSRAWRERVRHGIRLWPWVIIALIIPAYTLGVTEFLDRERATETGSDPHLTAERVLLLTQERQVLPFTRIEYALTQINVVRTYVRLVLWPAGLHLDWDYPITRSLLAGWTLPSLGLLLGLLTLAVWLLRYGWRLAGAGILFFFLALLPESSLIPIFDVLFEHRLYLPLFGAACVFAEVVVRSWLLVNRRAAGAAGAVVLIAFLWLGALSIATFQRNLVWRDSLSIWADSAAKSPDKPRPHNNVGLEYFAVGRDAEALRAFLRAAELDPDYAEAHNNIGMVHIRLGNLDEAERHLARALELKENYSHAHSNLGAVHLQRDELAAAQAAFERAVAIDADYAAGLDNLGLVLIRQGQLTAAADILQRNIDLNPSFISSYNNLGVVYARQGKRAEAIRLFEHALRINPGDSLARYNLRQLQGGGTAGGIQVLP